MSRVIGYVRVSTGEQEDGLEAQRQAILARFPEAELLEPEHLSGGRMAEERPILWAALGGLQRGDTLVVHRVDRLSRSLLDFAQLLERSRAEGWNLACLDLALDTSTAQGEAMAGMLAVFAQLERRLISDRTRAVLAVKKQQGVVLGRPVADDGRNEIILGLRAEGNTVAEIQRQTGFHREAVNRVLRRAS